MVRMYSWEVIAENLQQAVEYDSKQVLYDELIEDGSLILLDSMKSKQCLPILSDRIRVNTWCKYRAYGEEGEGRVSARVHAAQHTPPLLLRFPCK